MNKLIPHLLISLCLFFLSCSEGDILENNINNFDAPLETCSNSNKNTFVFYKINQGNKASFSIGFTSTTFDLNTAPEDASITIALNTTTNTFIYREFESEINSKSYYCASIPPAGIVINKEFISTSGIIQIQYLKMTETDTSTTYQRTITLLDITLEGPDFSLRQELLQFGKDEIIVPK